MESFDQIQLWKEIDADLQGSLATLPPEARENAVVRDAEEYLSHNELGLACDMLEAYGERHTVSSEFWIGLRNAAVKMQLESQADRYARLADNT